MLRITISMAGQRIVGVAMWNAVILPFPRKGTFAMAEAATGKKHLPPGSY